MARPDPIAQASSGPVGIIGAGIAGLTLALCLKKQGHDPVLFEMRGREALVTEGAFITLAPNAINALRMTGLADIVAESGLITTGIELLDERGRRLGYAEQADHPQAFGAPSVTIARGVLMEILATACEACGVAIHYRTSPTDIDDLRDRVRVKTDDGRHHVFGWLAACDGLRSRTRRHAFPEAPRPKFTGLIGTGGIASADDVASTGGTMRMVFGHCAFFGYLKQGNGPVYWFNSYPAQKPDAGHAPSFYVERLRLMHRADAPVVDAILKHVPQIARDYPIFDMPPLPSWHRGRIVLLGDAAHAIGPHSGQGAAMAIEDAVALTACVGLEGNITQAFRRFEIMRRARVEEVARVTARNGGQKRASGWFGRLVRRVMLPLVLPVGIRAGRALLTYRMDADPAVKSGLNGKAMTGRISRDASAGVMQDINPRSVGSAAARWCPPPA